MKKTLLFDAGGTLVQLNWKRVASILAAHGVSVDPETLRRAEPRAHRRLDTPEHFSNTTDRSRGNIYMREICLEAGLGRVGDDVLDAIRRHHEWENIWDVPTEGVEAMLESLRPFRRAVVSNSNGTVAEKLERVGLATHFEHIFDSGKLGVEKPDPRIFRIALDEMEVRATDAVYLGDLYHVDVLGARAAGMDVVLFDPHDLYADHDCARVRSLSEFIQRVL